MKQGIPVPLVRANQWVMVGGILLAILLQSQLLLTLLFIISLLALLFGPKGNVVFVLTKPLLKNRLAAAEQEAAELQRFNQSIATILLGLAVGILWTTGHWSGWIPAGMVMVAAAFALAGYCIGCTIYFQWKQWRHTQRS
ncbi:hypothetical protein J2S00_000752 [Caldalkalibacillus uzonensis]|uniref:DUF4395 domain-containing protein n=1 Tax=Caldalkalibacillus uzonensis TaxID=353224 RepID=A0ABU0CPZ0_9BACI|nr:MULTISPECIES: DUF4395 family protein [Caldalkalibacillus]MDQ0337969.1 hypothetical protein [Caldalkalibacillus uzonensis]GGK17093.1 hypothetical protein GCM10010965_07680 [Caldalkalibacillus thermarum]